MLKCSVFCSSNLYGKIPSSVVTIVITSLFSVCVSERDVPRKGGTKLYVTGRPHGTSAVPCFIYSCKF